MSYILVKKGKKIFPCLVTLWENMSGGLTNGRGNFKATQYSGMTWEMLPDFTQTYTKTVGQEAGKNFVKKL